MMWLCKIRSGEQTYMSGTWYGWRKLKRPMFVPRWLAKLRQRVAPVSREGSGPVSEKQTGRPGYEGDNGN